MFDIVNALTKFRGGSFCCLRHNIVVGYELSVAFCLVVSNDFTCWQLYLFVNVHFWPSLVFFVSLPPLHTCFVTFISLVSSKLSVV